MSVCPLCSVMLLLTLLSVLEVVLFVVCLILGSGEAANSLYSTKAKYKVGAPPCTRALPHTFPLSRLTRTAQGQLVRAAIESSGHCDPMPCLQFAP